MTITADELELIVEALLIEGVPSGVVARVFGLDTELVKTALLSVRQKTYGTDDLQEYSEQLQWDAIEHARDVIANGAEADKLKFMGLVLGKHMALSSRRTPESTRRAQESLMDILGKQRTGDAAPVPRSKFIVSVGDDA